ncbi:MAG: CapA family protein [Cyclobacteriaceae bacterium]|nr:CapA family protein [Cyclobacteriaceae bacterium]
MMYKGLIFIILTGNVFFLNAQDTTQISLLFLGDIMQHETQLQAAYNSKTGRYNYTECFKFLRPYFQSVDLTIGNLELTLGGKPFKGYPQFSAPDELAVALKNVGVDVLVTANNHSVDRRKKGLERTIKVLDSLQIMHTGTFADTVDRMNDYPLLIHRNGFTLALLNYTYGTNGIPVTKPNIVNLIDTALIRKDLVRARELKPDATIVFMHWGNEYENQPTRQQRMLAEFCFKHGAQLVIGAHPHVLQPMEWSKEKNQLVVYSLGNFVSGQRPRYRDGGAMLQVVLNKVISVDTAYTFINEAEYRLQWVYRATDAQRSFYVLPVASFEYDSTAFIKDESSRQAFKTFVDDSRKLLTKYNLGIDELSTHPPDTTITYTLFIAEARTSEEVYNILLQADSFSYGLASTNHETITSFYTGNFRSYEKAVQVMEKLKADWPELKIIRVINGVMGEE